MELLEPRCLMDGGLAHLVDDRFEVRTNQPTMVLDVLANDEFGTGYTGDRRISSVSYGSQGGRVELAADRRAVVYTPPPDFDGSETFVYLVDNAFPARVTVSIVSPIAADQFEIIQASGPIDLDVLANDPFWPDYAGTRQIRFVSETSAGSDVDIIDQGRRIRYTPAPDATGYDSFSYFVDNGFEAKVSITLHQPVRGDYYELEQNSGDNLLLLTSNDFVQFYKDLHIEDVVNRITSVTAPEQGGTVEIFADGQGVRYSPPPDFVGSDHFQYIADGRYEATVSVYVTRPVRDDTVYALQDSGAIPLDVLANDFRSDAYAGDRVITAVTESEHGATVKILEDGRAVEYAPPPGFTGSDSFTYTVDGVLEARVWAYVQPRAHGDYYNFCVQPSANRLNLPVLDNDAFGTDYSGAGQITAITQQSSSGAVTISEDGKRILLDQTSTAPFYSSFRYVVDDRYEAIVSVSVRGYLRSDAFTVDQNSRHVILDVLQNDDFERGCWLHAAPEPYTGPRIITAVGESEHGGEVTVGEDGKTVHYSPPADFTGTDRFTYTVDGNQQATAYVEVIRRVRDDRFHVDRGSAKNRLSVLINDGFGTDYSGNRRITDVTAFVAGATVAVSADGQSIVYTPPAGFSGTDTLTYTVDGQLKAEVEVVVQRSRSGVLPRFGSDSDLEQFLIDQAIEQFKYQFDGDVPSCGWLRDRFETTDSLCYAITTNTAKAEDSPGYSETNVQVQGVDEGDIIENDGRYLYVLTGNDLVIVEAWPANKVREVSRMAIEGTPIAEFLHGDRLTIISRVYEHTPMLEPIDLFGPAPAVTSTVLDASSRRLTIGRPLTRVTVIDVADRTAPKILETTDFEASYVDSRAIGDQVYLVLESHLDLPRPQQICKRPDATDSSVQPSVRSCRYESRDEYVARLRADRAALFDQALPNFTRHAGNDAPVAGLLNTAETIVRPFTTGADKLVSIVSLDIAAAKPHIADTEGVLTDGASKIYGSLENLYVFDQGWSADEGTTTPILQFAWGDASGDVQLVATGDVPGRLLNQFSADEHNGYLRLATTVDGRSTGGGSAFHGRSHNDLFVLRDDHGVLEFVAALQDLAPSETIRSMRFMGDRAFMTTFREIDPLFALDLSDPANPQVVGELHIPGFSSYMQPIDANHLLTVGMNTVNGWSGPAQVSLSDIRDMTRPVLIDNFTFERFSFSEAAFDHHAFGWFAEHHVLAIPTGRTYTVHEDTNGDGFRETRRSVREDELLVFRIDVTPTEFSDNGIQLLGNVDHQGAVRRSAYIGDVLYSVATDSIKAVAIADPDRLISELQLGGEDPYGGPIMVIPLAASFAGDGGSTNDPGGQTPVEPGNDPSDREPGDDPADGNDLAMADLIADLPDASVSIIADPSAPDDNVLAIVGTDQQDGIVIRRLHRGREVRVRVNRERFGPFDAAAIDRILIDGRAGDDLVRMPKTLHAPLVIQDQARNDSPMFLPIAEGKRPDQDRVLDDRLSRSDSLGATIRSVRLHRTAHERVGRR